MVNDLVKEQNQNISLNMIREEILYRENLGSNKTLTSPDSILIIDSVLTITDSDAYMSAESIYVKSYKEFENYSVDSLKLLFPIYPNDGRTEYYQLTNNQKSTVSTVVCLIDKKQLKKKDGYFELQANSFGEKVNLCKSEKFYNQPLGGFCSGFIVKENVIVTADHCLHNRNLLDFYVLLDYYLTNQDEVRTRFESNMVHEVKRVIKSGYNDEKDIDFAVLELETNVDKNRICIIRSEEVRLNEAVSVAGHPVGLPLKYSPGATVKFNDSKNYFVADLDTYGGNSGSPVFDSQNRVIGILVRGAKDFKTIRSENCRRSYVCNKITRSNRNITNICIGEEITRNSQFVNFIPQ
jgi:V8-like Glu-specific endopeptidase